MFYTLKYKFMQPKIDDLVHKKDEIQSSLDNLSKLTEKTEKEKVQKEISDKLSQLKKEIETYETSDDSEKNKLNSLKTDVDKISDTLKKFESELKSLEQWVLSSQGTTTPTETKKDEDKGLREKTKDFVSENWSDVTSWEKWKEEPWKNVLRAVGFWVTWYAIYKGVKWLWNWAFWDKEDEDWEEKEKKEKKWFWKTTAWKFLKWTWIGVWAGTLWYRLGKKFGLWGEDEKKPTDASPDEVKFKAYEEFYKNPSNKEAVENYELLWENVDITYEALYSRELQAWYQDELEMQRIAKEQSWWVEKYKWIIPFCLDNKFWSIENILSQNSSMREAMSWWLRTMVTYVKWLGVDFMKMFADSFLSTLPSWMKLANFQGSLSEKIDKWISENNNAEKELQFFFRQSIRVQTYLFEKKDQLIDKIADVNSRKYGISKEKILDDKEKYKEYIENDATLVTFLTSPISTWVNVLKEKAIFNSNVGKDVEKAVENLDKERNDVLDNTGGWKDILQIINEKADKKETITDAEKQKLAKACDGIIKEVDDRIMDAVEESAWNTYWDLFNTDAANLRKYLKKSGLEKVFQEYKTKITEMKWELLAWRLSNEKIAALSQSINSMLALKKEAILWANTIEKDYDENWNFIYRIPWFLSDSIWNIGKSMEKLYNWELWAWAEYLASAWAWTGLIITAAWVVYAIKTGKTWGIKFWVKLAILPATVVYSIWKMALTRTPVWRKLWKKIVYGSPECIQSISIFRWKQWPDKLFEAFKLWRITLTDAENMAKRKITSMFWLQETKDKWCDMFKVTEDDINAAKIRERIFDKYIIDSTRDTRYLETLKSNNELYEKSVKYFDDSAELRTAVRYWKPLDVVEKEIKKVEIAKGVISDSVDDIIEPAADLAENIHYKKLKADIESEITSLQRVKTQVKDSPAKVRQIEGQIDKLKEFKKNINRASVQEVESLEWIYSSLIKVKKWKWFFDNIDTITRLVSEESESLHNALNKLDWEELKRIIKELQKENKLTDISDEAIISFTKVLNEIKVKSFLKYGEKLVTALKTFIKFMWKLR